MRKSLWFAALVLLCGSMYPAAAYILPCESCTCAHSCTQSCDVTSTCGAYGVCNGTPGCGGCLTVQDIENLDRRMRGVNDAASLSDQRGEVAARLTWRLTQHVEELGLGTVFAGGTRFHLPGRAQAPALAFLHAGAPKNASVPDMAVELLANPARREAVVDGWLAMGVRAVLTVDPSTRSVVVYQGQDVKVLGEADFLELPDVVPGWSLRVRDLFE